MALNAPRAWLIAYDIASPRRLGRLHRFIKKNAVPVQYSVFYFEGSTSQVRRLLADIEKRISAREDDVRAYPVPNVPEYYSIGRGSMPDSGLLLSPVNTALVGLTQGAAVR
jgi:CRISPR-associated protein Cas2